VPDFKITKVSAMVDLLGPSCTSKDGDKYCYYFNMDCVKNNVFPGCSEESIVYLKVVNET